jgi:hypothetical protein
VAAQPVTDRSLNADKPVPAVRAVPVPGVAPETPVPATDNAGDATNAAPVTAVDTHPNAPAQPGDNTPVLDPATMTRDQLQDRVKTLSEQLATVNKESEYFREQWTELKLRDEALGVEALTVDEAKLEDKVVQAVKEAYQNEMKHREALLLLGKLLDTTDQMLATAPNYDPKVRAEYEVTSRAAKEVIAGHSGAAIPLASSLADGRVVDCNPDLNAVILNLGKSQGVKEGMPFTIYHDTTEVGTVKIVLARDQVSAAQVEILKPNLVPKVGDRAVVQANQASQ